MPVIFISIILLMRFRGNAALIWLVPRFNNLTTKTYLQLISYIHLHVVSHLSAPIFKHVLGNALDANSKEFLDVNFCPRRPDGLVFRARLGLLKRGQEKVGPF